MSADSIMTDTGTIEVTPQSVNTENTALTDEEVRRNTKTLIDFRDNVQGYGISYISDGDLQHANLYQYSQWQKNKLVEAWMPIIAKTGLRISPWVDVLMAEVICTGPLVGLCLQNRKIRLENEQMKKKIVEMQANMSVLQHEYKDARTDSKNAWKVDGNGNFEYTPKGTYIKLNDRNEKPELTPANYTLLCKHNGKELIDKIFNIQL